MMDVLMLLMGLISTGLNRWDQVSLYLVHAGIHSVAAEALLPWPTPHAHAPCGFAQQQQVATLNVK